MAANRERRSNAGNRLRALLNEEEEMEELFDDEGVDEEFEIEGKEQEDIVDSDFDQSSADEEPADDEESNLAEDPEEAKARRKQQAMLSHLKTGKSSFSIPGVGSSVVTGGRRTKSSRQSASATVATKKKSGAQTTTFGRSTTTTSSVTTTTSTSAAASPAPSSASFIKIPAEIRKSSRRTTVLNNQETELKLLEYETRKAMQPKREKVVAHKMTQAELLEEAKKTEELNLASLQAFKAMEMEKKRVVKKKDVAMESFVRYHSFAEWIGHGPLIQALADTGTPGGTRPPTRPGSRAGSRAGSAAPEIIPTQYGSGQSGSGGVPPQNLAQSLAQSLLQQQQIQLQQEQNASRSINMTWDSNSVSEGIKQHKIELNGLDSDLGSKTPASPMNLDGAFSRDVKMASPGLGAASGTTDLPSGALTPAYYSTMNMSAGSIARKRKRLHPTQMCGRNWITFVGYEEEDSPINEWSYAENYPERKPMCPITGLPAKYKDPRSGIPYANKEAYKVLQNVIRHGYVWSNGLNAYCHDVAQPLPKGVPAGMAEALIGGQQIGEGIVLKDGDLISAGIPGGGGGGYTYRRRQLLQQVAYQD
ncbi:Vacuolar protein sorting-associated protein 72 [Haplosporangium sp. Z 767]|nr:Vacuolar protein sorting-associated protein 72 [Haplosporangium sp. Z 767]KAF9189824.1 Vacuolar protein sorting-associated protein 72 [Haplosporangium sp. Z 11]